MLQLAFGLKFDKIWQGNDSYDLQNNKQSLLR